MAEIAAETQPIEAREEVQDGEPSNDVRFWLQQLKLSEKEDRDFIRRGRKIVKRYRDERHSSTGTRSARFNILWANVETLKPILYGRTPNPDVQRRHKDNDAIARHGAEILERALGYEDDLDEFDAVMDQVVEDLLIPGRGVARVYYEPEFGPEEDDPDATPGDETQNDGDADDERRTYRPIVAERAPIRYQFWEDYRESPARFSAHEVWWKAYRSYMTRDELVTRFGPIGKKVTLDYSPKGVEGAGKETDDSGPRADAFKKAEIWEIWDKSKKQVVWVAPSYTEELLDETDDPYNLPGFYPSPEPLLSTTTNDRRQPIADFLQYQDQATELDILTSRIDRLQGALKVAGIYPAGEKSTLQQLVDENTENRLIPVEDWAVLMDRCGGDMTKLILWLPIEQIAKVLIQLYDARDRVQKTLYQVTGMADILRGETDPNETLGAQQLKSQFATRRITKAQKKVARFARDLMRLRGFILATKFQPQTLSDMTGLPEPMDQLPPPPPQLIPAPPQPAPSPMMGHNGGPPMSAPGVNATPISPSPGVAAAHPPGAPMQGPMAA